MFCVYSDVDVGGLSLVEQDECKPPALAAVVLSVPQRCSLKTDRREDGYDSSADRAELGPRGYLALELAGGAKSIRLPA